MTSTIKASEARAKLFGLMDRAERLRQRFVLTRDGRPQAVLISAEEYEEWMETLEVSQDKGLVKGIREGLADLKAGRTLSFERVFERAK